MNSRPLKSPAMCVRHMHLWFISYSNALICKSLTNLTDHLQLQRLLLVCLQGSTKVDTYFVEKHSTSPVLQGGSHTFAGEGREGKKTLVPPEIKPA